MGYSILGNLKASFAPAGGWPADKISAVLRRRYQKVSTLGNEDAFTLYGIEDNGLKFVVALIGVEGAPDRVAEIAFLASFVKGGVTQQAVEMINRNLHISYAGLDEKGALVLLAGVQASGAYEESTFILLLDVWKRDLLMVLQVLSGRASLAEASPIARSEAAMSFASNRLAEGGDGADPLSALLSANIGKGFCGECGGRGKRGFVARTCESCDGTGFVKTRRR
jgi:hypothetical protein